MTQANGYNAYAQNKVMTASPAELTLMLYEGAIKFCNIAVVAIEQKDFEKANTNIQKAQNEAETLRIENQKLSIEIQTLQNKERIYTIAQDAGLEQQSNIVSIAGGASETE